MAVFWTCVVGFKYQIFKSPSPLKRIVAKGDDQIPVIAEMAAMGSGRIAARLHAAASRDLQLLGDGGVRCRNV